MDQETIKTIVNLEPKDLYEKGIAFKEAKDYTNYSIYMTMAANKDYPQAINETSDDYYNNNLHLKQNFSYTTPFYEATLAYSYSALYLGYIYKLGHSVLKDKKKEDELHKLALDKGNMHAIHNEACDTKDKQKAKELWELAASKGSYRSFNSLGQLYFKGYPKFNIIQDYNKARQYYEEAFYVDKDIAINSLIELYQKTNLKDDKDYVFNYFTQINRVDALQKIYNFDQFITDLLKESVKLQEHIKSNKNTNCDKGICTNCNNPLDPNNIVTCSCDKKLISVQ